MWYHLAVIDPNSFIIFAVGVVCTILGWAITKGLQFIFQQGEDRAWKKTIEEEMDKTLKIANQALTTANAAHAMVKEVTNTVGSMREDIKQDFNTINKNISDLRDEILDIYKKR